MHSEEEIERDWQALCASGRRRMFIKASGERFGDIIDERHIVEDAGKLGDYVKLVQRVKRPDGEQWIRFTYYVKRPGWESWKLAGQTSLMLSLGDARKLLKKSKDAGIL